MKRKIVAHLWSLPRWFALPFFGGACLLGASVSRGINANVWIALIGVLLVMAGGHSLNSYLDYAWTGLDKGEKEDRSAEKIYTGGQNLIENGVVGLNEILINAAVCYLLSAIPIVYLIAVQHVTAFIIVPWVCGMLVTFWYSKAKFNYTHELSLAVGVGPLPAVIGGMASGHLMLVNTLLASVPFMIVLSIAGLALDEWPDAEANLKKGVKSMAYEVWKWSDWIKVKQRITEQRQDGNTLYFKDYGEQEISIKSLTTLQWYLTSWFLFMFVFQGLLVFLGILKPLTCIAYLIFPALTTCLLMLKSNFKKWAAILVIVGAAYGILMLVGQVI